MTDPNYKGSQYNAMARWEIMISHVNIYEYWLLMIQYHVHSMHLTITFFPKMVGEDSEVYLRIKGR